MEPRKAFSLFVMLVLFLLVVMTIPVRAAVVDLNWNLPTQNCDGSAIDDYAYTIIKWGEVSGGPYPNEIIVGNPPSPTATNATIDVGEVYDTTLYFVAVGVDTAGNRSDGEHGCFIGNELPIPFGPRPPVAPRSPDNLRGLILEP